MGAKAPPILFLYLTFLILISSQFGESRRQRSVSELEEAINNNRNLNDVEFIWSTQTVALGDTAVLHCSFDAIFSQLRNGNIDWVKEGAKKDDKATLVASGKRVVFASKRYRVYRPHNSALSVLIVRRAKKRDAGIYRCNLSGSSTRHKYLILNVTESKIEAKTSPFKLKARIGKDVTMWCNATGYPRPVVYWTREDHNRRLPDGSYQFWGNGMHVPRAGESDTGVYACYLDNFVQPVVSYKFSLMVEDRPWHIDAFKMRFDSSRWYTHRDPDPAPMLRKSYLLMCETRGYPQPLPRITWQRDGKEIVNSRHYYILEDRPEWRTSYTSSTLVIMKFSPKQQGRYTCVATNSYRSRKKDFIVKGAERVKPPSVSVTPSTASPHSYVDPGKESSPEITEPDSGLSFPGKIHVAEDGAFPDGDQTSSTEGTPEDKIPNTTTGNLTETNMTHESLLDDEDFNQDGGSASGSDLTSDKLSTVE